MFKAVFSFNGRIRRTEYALTRILVVFLVLVISAAAETKGAEAIGLLILLPLYIHIAQAVKRCHDRGNPGWWMLIPFYDFILFFGAGDYGPNEYGENPKGEGNEEDPFATDFKPEADFQISNGQIPGKEI